MHYKQTTKPTPPIKGWKKHLNWQSACIIAITMGVVFGLWHLTFFKKSDAKKKNKDHKHNSK